jgi:hypothetical protein
MRGFKVLRVVAYDLGNLVDWLSIWDMDLDLDEFVNPLLFTTVLAVSNFEVLEFDLFGDRIGLEGNFLGAFFHFSETCHSWFGISLWFYRN